MKITGNKRTSDYRENLKYGLINVKYHVLRRRKKSEQKMNREKTTEVKNCMYCVGGTKLWRHIFSK